jgi:AAA ATPase domain
VPAWRVLSAGTAEGRFEALHGTITPLVGRDEEMEMLQRRWAQAKAGNGKVVLISAEPGVGKSRLAETLIERIAPEPHIRLRWFCSQVQAHWASDPRPFLVGHVHDICGVHFPGLIGIAPEVTMAAGNHRRS